MSDDATSAAPLTARIAFVDVLRALAVCRVVVNHALPWGWIQWFPSMPILFFFSGTLMAQSLQRRPWGNVFVSRVRRIALPLGAYLAFVVVAQLSGLMTGTTIQLWYVWNFLAFAALSGVFLWLIRRFAWLTVGGLLLVVVGLGVLAITLRAEHASAADQVQALSVGAAYEFFWVLGMLWAERGFPAPRRAVLVVAVVVGAAVGVVDVAVMHRGLDATAAANLYGVALAGTGLAGLALGLVFRKQLEVLLGVPGLGPFIHYVNRRLLTIYLWHIPALIVGWKLADLLDLDAEPAAVLVLAVTIGLTAVGAVAFGGLEDRAESSAKRTGSGSPRLAR